VLCSGAGDATVLSRIAERIIQKTSVPFNVDGRECWYGASIGVAVMRGGDIRPRELLVNADMALYRAKSRGRGCYEYFSADLQAEIVRSKTTADAIRAGLPRGEFVPYFQAQIDARTFQIAGFEALARWHHPTDGVLSPAAFLGIAEDLNVVSQIDRAMLEATLRHYRAWTDEHLPVPRLSINVSSRRLREPDLIAGLRELNLPRGVFSFELLESAFLDNADEQIVWNLDMLREMGLDVELDDFGSGHASIISLIKLRPDALKIDRELIATITTDPSRRDLVRSIIDIGRSLNVRVVAEGVETLGQADLLRDLGCDTLQGYVFSKPMPAQAVPGFIQDWTAQPQQLTG
ncbi:MAG: GGDEF domain-containing phosphodiesterase, partial [Pseudomonadota bacterium]